MKGLTDKQKEILDFITQYLERENVAPTVREVGEHFGISLRAVQDHIVACQKKGFLTHTKNRSRSIRINYSGSKSPYLAQVPLLFETATGIPLVTEANTEKIICIAEPLVCENKEYFALRVLGASMMGAGILDGDIAIIEKKDTAQEGAIVVAVIDNGVTLKRLYHDNGKVRLQAENTEFQPIYANNVTIAGVMTGLIRTSGI